MAYFMGIDVGSRTTKGVIAYGSRVKTFHAIFSGYNYRGAAEKIREGLLSRARLQAVDIAYTVATGQSVDNLSFPFHKASDTRCCARGISSLFPEVRTVIDVQGQSTQIIRVDEKGKVVNFVVSERCAAGSGRFLEIIANVLRINLKDVGPLSLKSQNPVVFTTSCAVFGESEAISRVAEGTPKEDILAGVHRALAQKISALIDRVGFEEKCAISGGGGLDIGLVKAIEQELGLKLLIPQKPELVSALGASIMAQLFKA
jgi:predicted CoA-substrate-specific enzyme activase